MLFRRAAGECECECLRVSGIVYSGLVGSKALQYTTTRNPLSSFGKENIFSQKKQGIKLDKICGQIVASVGWVVNKIVDNSTTRH